MDTEGYGGAAVVDRAVAIGGVGAGIVGVIDRLAQAAETVTWCIVVVERVDVRRGAELIGADVASGLTKGGPRSAALVGPRAVGISLGNGRNRRAVGLQRDGIGWSAVVGEARATQIRIDVVADGLPARTEVAGAKIAGAVIGDVVTTVGAEGDGPCAVSPRPLPARIELLMVTVPLPL